MAIISSWLLPGTRAHSRSVNRTVCLFPPFFLTQNSFKSASLNRISTYKLLEIKKKKKVEAKASFPDTKRWYKTSGNLHVDTRLATNGFINQLHVKESIHYVSDNWQSLNCFWSTTPLTLTLPPAPNVEPQAAASRDTQKSVRNANSQIPPQT